MDGEVDITPTEYTTKIYFKYKVKEQHFIITIQHYDGEVMPEIVATEKDTGFVEQYLANNRLFYIISNNNSINAAWSDGSSHIITIIGNLSVENTHQLLDSMGV